LKEQQQIGDEAGANGSLFPSDDNAVAIVGYAFRFPGNHSDGEAFWQALKEGRDLVTRVPEDRWAVDELEHPKRSEPGRSITFSAGVLSRIDEFDANFFGISPREAAWLDPQQRLLLEMSWEAMENAGHLPSSLAGSDCAVYIGISGLDYGTRGLGDLASFSSHVMTGNTLSIAANRLSYVFDLRGPSLAVDTACSSSLVALHHACSSLHSGEASMAIAGGVNLLLNPYPFVGFTKASMLSADGRCKSFDAAGDGYVRSEGGAVLLLKPLKAALADGDNIEGVILASGVNTDGARKTGITIPSSQGQAELMRKVLKRSGLEAGDVDFLEAHGTGTAIGDPIETTAIGEVFGVGREKPLPIGSVKANLGHLEPASGMAGLVKTLLALKHRELPPSIHLETPNPMIDFKGLNLELTGSCKKLAPENEKSLVAGVNSFGFGGANAHVLLASPPSADQAQQACRDSVKDVPPLFLSARSDDALKALALRYAELLQGGSAEDLYDVAFATLQHRDRLQKRLAVTAQTPAEVVDELLLFAKGDSADVFVEDALPGGGNLAFVYSGNGSQWLGMGRDLLQASPRFSAIIAKVDKAVQSIAGFSVIEELMAEAEASRLEDTVVAQPLLFAVQVALTQLLADQGCRPKAVTGHSVGEVTAAWAAGALDFDQAVRLICARSEAQGHARGEGRMAVVGLSESAFEGLLDELDEPLDIEIAGINSPTNLTIAGSLAAIKHVELRAQSKGAFFHLLDLDYAFHSHYMDSIQPLLADSLQGLEPGSTDQAVYVSTVTGGVTEGGVLDADYWWRNVRQPVRFAAAINCLVEMGCRVFVEIGPHAILQRYIAECLQAANVQGRTLPTLRRDDDGHERVTEVVLRQLMLSEEPDFSGWFPQPGKPVRLPNYPWQKERYWLPKTSESLDLLDRRRVHPLLGWKLPEAKLAWQNALDPEVLPWLADHQVGGTIVFPGAAYVEMALAAAQEWLEGEHLAIEELDIVAPMVFDGEHARVLRLEINERDGSFQISSQQRLADGPSTLHASGRIIQTTERLPRPTIASAPEDGQLIDAKEHYALASRLGLDYGKAFQRLEAMRLGVSRLQGTLTPPQEEEAEDDYLVVPAILDVCFQSLVDLFRDDIQSGQGIAFLPVRVGRLEIARKGVIAEFRGDLRRFSRRSALADFELFDADGGLLVRATGCRFRAAPLGLKNNDFVSQWCTVPVLQPHPVDGFVSSLPTQQVLLQSLRLNASTDEPQRARWFMQTLPLFEALTLSFAYEAFRKVAAADDVSFAELLNSDSEYVRWLSGILRQEGLLVVNGDGVYLAQDADLPDSQEIWQALLSDSPECLPQLALLGRVGRHLHEVLNGRIDQAEFHENVRLSPAAEVLYADDPAYSGVRQAIGSVLSDLAVDWPVHRRLRVLEIAASASELPRDLFELLPQDRLDYVLAVGEEALLERQAADYQDAPNVHVVELEAESLQLSGDGLPQRYDVVILRHVLHAAGKPHALLTRARRRLAADGLLLTAERYADWSADFLGGLNPNWWHTRNAGSDNEMDVPVSSLHSPAAWQSLMVEEGFEEVELFTEPSAQGLAEGAYLLLARNSQSQAEMLESPQAASWTLLADKSALSVAEHVKAQLESHEQRVFVSGPEKALPDDQIDNVVLMLGWEESSTAVADVLSRAVSLVQRLAASEQASRLWVVTNGGALVSDLPEEHVANPVQAALSGFVRVAMNEFPGLHCTLIDLLSTKNFTDQVRRLVNELLWPDGLDEVVLGREARFGLSLREAKLRSEVEEKAEARFRLDFKVPGQLRNLLWLPEPERVLDEREVEVRCMATGLNFRDVMYLMGLLPDEAVENGFAGASLGLEFSGVVTRVGAAVRDIAPGERVMGFGASCFASHVVTRSDALVQIPEDWDFQAAATVPTVFFTVFYALHHLAELQPGERVLIHGAAGGVGIAAVQLARHMGAEVFATAGSDEKRDFVRLLGADHVLDSRSLAFADDILSITNDEGVDVVLNSLAGEAVRRNLGVLKPFGRFLELGKRDFFENTPIGLRPFKDNISYFGIDADQLLTARPQLAGSLFRQLMELFREGALTPLPYRVFRANRVVEAFRYMQQARHIGKVVVSLADAQPVVSDSVEVIDLELDADSTWLITGGLSGFGLESARWLVEHGARNLVLLGRRGSETPGASEAVEELVAQGARAEVRSCDVTDAKALDKVIKWVCDAMPPLRGVLHAAMVIDDRLIGNLDAESMAAVLEPKLLGAWNLHQLTLDIPLNYFVLYSSITTSVGNPGQGNYVAANAGLEGVAELRRGMGLPATSIGWGPISDAGYLTRNESVKESLEQRLGRAPLSAKQALDQLQQLLTVDAGVRGVANYDWKTLSRILPSSNSARFGWLNHALEDSGLTDENIDFQALIVGKSEQEVQELVLELVVTEVAQTLCVSKERVDPYRSLQDMGMDSLMAVELALGLEQRFSIQLPAMLLSDSPSAMRVTQLIVQKLLGGGDADTDDSSSLAMKEMARQHGEEAPPSSELDGLVKEAEGLATKGTSLIG